MALNESPDNSFVEQLMDYELSDISETILSIDQELVINSILPGLSLNEPTAILIDVNNLYRRSKENGFRINYLELSRIFGARCNLLSRSLFTAVDRDNPDGGRWVDFMIRHGFNVVDKDLKKHIAPDGRLICKGNMDIEMTIAAMSLPASFEHIILGTCDADFVPLVEELKNRQGKTVSVLGMHIGDSNVGMPRSLIKAADRFYDMNKLIDFISYQRSEPCDTESE